MWKNRLLYCCALLGAMVFFAYYTAWVSALVLLLALGLPLFSLLCSLPGMRRTRLEPGMPQRVRMGEKAKMECFIQSGRGGYVPLCRFAFLKTEGMEGTSSRQRVKMAGSVTFPLPTAHCGAVRCGFDKGRVYDLLGLFALPLEMPEEQELLVLPLPREMDPKPELDSFAMRRWRPKPGGGLAEVHEHREYRPGDPLREVHWKLSAKTDKLIVREAQEPEKLRALITLELSRDRKENDRVLGELLWLSRELLERDVPHQIGCLCGGGRLLRQEVAVEADLQSALERILRSAPAEPGDCPAERSFPQADWHCHLGKGEGQ